MTNTPEKEVKRSEKVIAKIIRRHTSFWNGWAVSSEAIEEKSLEAAKKILSYVKRTSKGA